MQVIITFYAKDDRLIVLVFLAFALFNTSRLLLR